MSDRVSIIIPTYKRETHYLDRAIQSLLNQTYANIEIIVVDDNGKGTAFQLKTEEFMRKYNSYSNIIYHHNENNIGGALSRNIGIDLASGEYVTFLDDDDEYLPYKIECQLTYMKEHDFDMTLTNLTLVNENKKVIDYRDHGYLKSFDNKMLLKTHIMRKLTGTPTFMYKKEKLVLIGSFDDVPIGQEFHLMLKTLENDLKIGHLNRSDVIAYRHNEGGISFGEVKIQGEKQQYNYIKKNYFHLFTFKEKQFIKFRYHIVFALAYKRNRQYIKASTNLVLAFIYSPIDALKESVHFYFKIKNIRIQRKLEKKCDSE